MLPVQSKMIKTVMCLLTFFGESTYYDWVGVALPLVICLKQPFAETDQTPPSPDQTPSRPLCPQIPITSTSQSFFKST